MSISEASLAKLADQIPLWARDLGFADAGIAEMELGEDRMHLQRWLRKGLHGGMDYMQRHAAIRAEPALLRPGTLSVISARMDCLPDAAAAERILADGTRAYIARYALGRDYHRVLRRRLLKLAERIELAIGPHGYRVMTDSAPVLEKALARNARLGWIGKNTLLMNREGGSWFFLGEIYTDLPLAPSAEPARQNHCGSCTACIDICPTQAILAPYTLDARRCISYLTIEHYGSIPVALRPLIGNRVFGCDDCQLVCPWNRYAKTAAEGDFKPRHGLDAVGLLELFDWSEALWLRRSEGMALRRLGYPRWLRNLAVALGNAPRSPEIVEALQRRMAFPDEVVREHVAWALQRQTAKLTAGSPPL